MCGKRSRIARVASNRVFQTSVPVVPTKDDTQPTGACADFAPITAVQAGNALEPATETVTLPFRIECRPTRRRRASLQDQPKMRIGLLTGRLLKPAFCEPMPPADHVADEQARPRGGIVIGR